MNLSERDRRVLIILVVFFGLIGAYLIVDYGIGKGGSGAVDTKEKELRDIIQLYRTFQQTKADFSDAEKAMKRSGDFELLSELETLADRAKVKGLIASMDKKKQPKNPYYNEEAVEVKLDRVTIVQLMDYLYELEYSPKVLRVKELHVEVRFDNKDQMNVRILASKYSPKGGSSADNS